MMRLYEAAAYYTKHGEADFIVSPEYIFSENETDAEHKCVIEYAEVLSNYRIEEVTILVRPFA